MILVTTNVSLVLYRCTNRAGLDIEACKKQRPCGWCAGGLVVDAPVILWLVRRWPCGWWAGCLVVGVPVALWLMRRLSCGWCVGGLVVGGPVVLWLVRRWPCGWCAGCLVVGAPVALWLMLPWPCGWGSGGLVVGVPLALWLVRRLPCGWCTRGLALGHTPWPGSLCWVVGQITSCLKVPGLVSQLEEGRESTDRCQPRNYWVKMINYLQCPKVGEYLAMC